MAGISTGAGEGGKRAVDHDIPLIPFIDLLLCCIMFLLVTAVWNQLARVDANIEPNGPTRAIDEPPPPPPTTVRVVTGGYVVAGPAGDRITIEREHGAPHDASALLEHLRDRRVIAPNERAMVVTADDGIAYAEVIRAFDAVAGAGYENLTVSGAM